MRGTSDCQTADNLVLRLPCVTPVCSSVDFYIIIVEAQRFLLRATIASREGEVVAAAATFPGWKRWYLLRDLADVIERLEGTEEQVTEQLAHIGRKHRVSAKRVYDFLQEHQFEVEQVRADRDNDYAGQWTANKAIREAAHEQFIEDIEAQLEGGWKEDPNVYAKLRRLQMLSLRYIEESRGELPQRLQVIADSDVSVRYTVEGGEDVQ